MLLRALQLHVHRNARDGLLSMYGYLNHVRAKGVYFILITDTQKALLIIEDAVNEIC